MQKLEFFKMASEKRIKAARVLRVKSTDAAAEPQFKIDSVDLTGAVFNSRVWMVSSVFAKIGFMLKSAETGPPGGETVTGPLSYLYMECNPNSKQFSKTPNVTAREAMVVARCDGGDLEYAQLNAALLFLRKFYSEAAHLENTTDDESLAEKERLTATLTPEAFKDFFDKFREQSVAKGDEQYVGVSLPEPISAKYCHMCGALEKEGQAKLLCCGGCKEVYYCDKRCQKPGWKLHKELCKIQSK